MKRKKSLMTKEQLRKKAEELASVLELEKRVMYLLEGQTRNIESALVEVWNEGIEEAAVVSTMSWPGSTPKEIRALKLPEGER
jgi:hypothetical protein